MLTKHRSLVAPPPDHAGTVVFGLIACLLLLSVASVADLVSRTAILYTIPIALAAWVLGRWLAAAVTGFAIASSVAIALFAHHQLGNLPIFIPGLILVGLIAIGGAEWARRSDELVEELNLGDRRHRQMLDTMTEVGKELVTSKRLDAIAEHVMDSLVKALALDCAWVFEHVGGDTPHKLLAWSGMPPPDATAGAPTEGLSEAGIIGHVELPVHVKGRTWGTVVMGFGRPRPLTIEERGIASALINQLGLAMENASAYRATVEALVQVEEVSQLKTDFMRTVSHELRTPLTVLSGYMELMADGSLGEVPEAWEKPLEKVTLKVRELNRMVQMMLEAARTDSPQLKLNIEEADLGAVTELAVAAQEPDAERAGLDIRFDRPRAPLVAACDRDKVQVALRNLIENAVKYSPPGAAVDVGVADDAEKVTIWVADRGPGVPAAEKPRIFDRFYRSPQPVTESVGGTGLGLFIVRQLSNAQGGTVDVEDRAGGGSVFTLSLPRTIPQLQPAAV
jgi:signal transduction histidine kinase